MNYDTICKYIGQLYVQSRAELESSLTNISDLQSQLTTAIKERDEALKMALDMESKRADASA